MEQENNQIFFKEKTQYIDFEDLLTDTETMLFRLSLVFKRFHENIKTKKDFYRRSAMMSVLWFSRIHLHYGDHKLALESLKDCYNLKDE